MDKQIKPKNWLLVTAVSTALGLSGAANAMHHGGVEGGTPAALKMQTVTKQFTPATGTKAKLWLVDAEGNRTSSDVSHSFNLSTGETASLSKGDYYTMVDIAQNSPLGPLELSASLATAGSTLNTESALIPLNVVNDQLLASPSFSNDTVVGTSVNMTVSAQSGADLNGSQISVLHFTQGAGSIPIEATPALMVENGQISFDLIYASGNLKTTDSEFYVVRSLDGALADAVVPNAGGDATPDFVPGASAGVSLLDMHGYPVSALPIAAAADGSLSASIPTDRFAMIDELGNVITTAGVTVDLAASTSTTGTIAADGTVSYPAGTTEDALSIALSAPTGAGSVDVKAVAANAEPTMNGLGLTRAYNVAAPRAAFKGGMSADGGPRSDMARGRHVSFLCKGTPSADLVGQNGVPFVLMLWAPADELLPNPYTGSGYVAEWWFDFGVGNFWNFDIASLGGTAEQPLADQEYNILNLPAIDMADFGHNSFFAIACGIRVGDVAETTFLMLDIDAE